MTTRNAREVPEQKSQTDHCPTCGRFTHRNADEFYAWVNHELRPFCDEKCYLDFDAREG